MPAFDDSVDITGAFLSWAVVSAYCTHCARSAGKAGPVDPVWPLWRHREHLGCVTVDLLLSGVGTDGISRMRLCLMPLEIQLVAMN